MFRLIEKIYSFRTFSTLLVHMRETYKYFMYGTGTHNTSDSFYNFKITTYPVGNYGRVDSPHHLMFAYNNIYVKD